MTRLFLLAILAAAAAPAHEIGTTRATVTFPGEHAYAIEIVTDPQSLDEKLAATGQAIQDRVKVVFDDTAVAPTVVRAAGTIRLTGAIPSGARTFSWSYGWTFATYSLTVNNSTQWLEGGQTSAPVPLSAPSPAAAHLDTIRRYLALGFTHIVPHGLDHVLFVLGIYLLSRRARSVLLQVSAFTVAHSITLGLSLYNVLSLPSSIVEPLIAISIAYVAIENIFLAELKSRRVALVFAFGLLHGMGFAGALQDVGLPRSEFLAALLGFNLGVEAGQLAVIAAAFLLVGRTFAARPWYRRRIVVPASAMIACMAVYWTLERWP
jgi:hydrogenase/urease accessory protein HupE